MSRPMARFPCLFSIYRGSPLAALPGASPELQLLAWRLSWLPGHLSGAWEQCADLWETACRLHVIDGAFCVPEEA